ncbi:MAG TPA: alpha/beta hydrolase [Acidimicrobiales bacterium]|nr:alpha/beta hydrolase [Acidimicrobiales bacterium]
MTATATEPTFLLIHGGCTTGAFWDRVVERLDAPAVAVDLPGRRDNPADLVTLTLDDSATSAVADLQAAAPDGPVVVVAHSSGGLVVPRVVDQLGDRVQAVVLTSASIPPDGGIGMQCMKDSHRERLEAGLEWARSEGRRLTAPKVEDPESLRESYGERLDDETVAYLADPSRSVEDSFNVYLQPVHWSTVRVPVTYLRAGLDKPVPPELQDRMIGHLPGRPTVVAWECGHVPAVTRPDDFVELLRG